MSPEHRSSNRSLLEEAHTLIVSAIMAHQRRNFTAPHVVDEMREWIERYHRERQQKDAT